MLRSNSLNMPKVDEIHRLGFLAFGLRDFLLV